MAPNERQENYTLSSLINGAFIGRILRRNCKWRPISGTQLEYKLMVRLLTSTGTLIYLEHTYTPLGSGDKFATQILCLFFYADDSTYTTNYVVPYIRKKMLL